MFPADPVMWAMARSGGVNPARAQGGNGEVTMASVQPVAVAALPSEAEEVGVSGAGSLDAVQPASSSAAARSTPLRTPTG